MCEPVTMFAASMALSAATAGAQYMGQQQAAKSQRNAQIAYNQALSEAARENANRQYEQIQVRQKQQIDQQKDQAAQERLQVEKAKARQRVSSGEAGVAGLSVNQLLAEFDREVGSIASVTLGNIDRINYQTDQEMRGAHAQAAGQPYDLTPVAQPSILTPLLKTAGGAAQSYRDFLYVPPSE